MSGTIWTAGTRPRHLRDGGFPAWPLPSGDDAPAAARDVARAVLTELGMAPGTVHDGKVIISELATNAVLHSGPGRGLPPAGGLEVWAHLRWRGRPEAVVKVFDPDPWRGPATPAPPLPAPLPAPDDAVGGRGLHVVDALTAEAGGRWGAHPTRSRLAARPVPGKAVFFTLPLPDAAAAPGAGAALRPVERICALLVARGLEPALTTASGTARLRMPDGPSCQVRAGWLWCALPGSAPVRHPAADAVEVAEQIVRWCQENAAPAPPAASPAGAAGG